MLRYLWTCPHKINKRKTFHIIYVCEILSIGNTVSVKVFTTKQFTQDTFSDREFIGVSNFDVQTTDSFINCEYLCFTWNKLKFYDAQIKQIVCMFMFKVFSFFLCFYASILLW